MQRVQLGAATREAGEPVHVGDNPTKHSVWFRWVAPADGEAAHFAHLETVPPYVEGQSRFLGAAIYTNTTDLAAVRNLSVPGVEVRGSSGFRGWIRRFNVAAGQEYLIVVDAGDGLAGTVAVGLLMTATGSPANDAVAGRAEFGNAPAIVDLGRATKEPGELGFGTWFHRSYSTGIFGNLIESTSNIERGGSSAWFEWIAPATGGYGASFTLPASVPQLAVYRTVSPLPVTQVSQLERVDFVGQGALTQDGVSQRRAQLSFRANAGERIFIQVDQLAAPTLLVQQPYLNPLPEAFSGERGIGYLEITPGPANDRFADALLLEGLEASVPTMLGASLEPEEPAVPVGAPAGSLWWRWRVPATKSYLIKGAEAFRGDALTNLVRAPVASKWPGGVTFDAKLGMIHLLDAVEGEWLMIRLLGSGDSVGRLQILPQSAHDQFADALELPANPEEWWSFSGATPVGPCSFEPGEPVPPYSQHRGSVWYRWVPPLTGGARIDVNELASAQEDGVVTVYRGDRLDQLSLLAVKTRFNPQPVFPITQGEAIYIQLSVVPGKWLGILRLSAPPPPPNDSFAKAQFMQATTSRLGLRAWYGIPTGNAFMATAEPGEPAHCGRPAQNSAWYKWVPNAWRDYTVRVGDSAPGRLAVYRGDSLTNLTLVGTNLWEGNYRSEPVRVKLQGNDVFWIAVDSVSYHEVNPTVVAQEVTPHDNFPAALEISQGITGVTAYATTYEAGEPVTNGPAGSLWVKWMHFADQEQLLSAYPDGAVSSAVAPRITLYTGAELASLRRLGTTPLLLGKSSGALRFFAERGVWYYIGIEPSVTTEHRILVRLTSYESQVRPASGPARLQLSPDHSVLSITGDADRHYLVETSRNLQDWVPGPLLLLQNPGAQVSWPNLLGDGETVYLRVTTP